MEWSLEPPCCCYDMHIEVQNKLDLQNCTPKEYVVSSHFVSRKGSLIPMNVTHDWIFLFNAYSIDEEVLIPISSSVCHPPSGIGSLLLHNTYPLQHNAVELQNRYPHQFVFHFFFQLSSLIHTVLMSESQVDVSKPVS